MALSIERCGEIPGGVKVTVTDELAQFIRQTTYPDLPSDVIHQAKRCFLDWMGVTLGGCRSPLASILLELVQCSGGT